MFKYIGENIYIHTHIVKYIFYLRKTVGEMVFVVMIC